LQIGATRYSFSGKVPKNGVPVTNSITRKKMTPLIVRLSNGSGSDSNVVSGTVTDGTWTSRITADRAIYNSKTKPAPNLGSFNLAVPGNDEDHSTPLGYGFGSLKLDGNGKITFAGTLADGSTMSQASG